ncbi:MAG: hypothetical protein AB7G37_10815, partial [Solirubrobacteraceae bacterium]
MDVITSPTQPPSTPATDGRRSRRTALVIALLGAILALAAPSASRAGTYAVDYCGLTGTADGFTAGATSPGRAEIDCTGTSPWMLGELHDQAWGEGSQVSFTFTAPDGTSIVQWRPRMTVTIFKHPGTNERFRFTLGATPASTFPINCYDTACPDTINASYAIHGGARQVEARITCVNQVPDSNLCKGSATLIDTGGTILLNDPHPPKIRAAASGAIPAATTPRKALRGTASISALVDDVGSGVAHTQLLIDGRAVAIAPNRCTPQPTSKRVPCPLAQQANVTWNTTSAQDGAHAAALVATDASGNQATLWQGHILIANHPIGPGSPPELRGNPTAPGTTDQAKITASFPATRKRRPKRCNRRAYRRSHRKTCRSRPSRALWKGGYSKHTLVLTGRVTNATGNAVPLAPVHLAGTVSRGPAPRWDITTRTDATGRWKVRIPRNIGSRAIQVSTFAREFDQVPSATTTARLLVRSKVTLKVNRRALRAGGRVRFAGRLAEHTSGVPITLEVHYRGKWRVFEAASTKTGGRF